MSVIGSLILDQIIYAEDLEKRKSQVIGEEAQRITASQTVALDNFKNTLYKELVEKQAQERNISKELNDRPLIEFKEVSKFVKTGGTKNKDVNFGNPEEKPSPEIQITVETKQIPNPIYKDKERISAQIENIKNEINKLENKKINLEETIKEDLKKKRGFLDELSLMVGILKDSWIALIVYFLVFLFLLSLELLVVFTKLYGQKTDLEKLLEYQVQTRYLTIDKLTQELNNSRRP
jgi:hypothetical protein